MKPQRSLVPTLRPLFFIIGSIALAVPFSRAQTAQPAAPNAATLAKYDRNKNGVLEPAEQAAMEADHVDAFVSYRTKLFADKIPATFRLNARNLQEGGRLQPIGVYPDGTPNAYRIVDPRQFILQATFDL